MPGPTHTHTERLHTKEKEAENCKVVYHKSEHEGPYKGTTFYIEVSDKTSARALKTFKKVLEEVKR